MGIVIYPRQNPFILPGTYRGIRSGHPLAHGLVFAVFGAGASVKEKISGRDLFSHGNASFGDTHMGGFSCYNPVGQDGFSVIPYLDFFEIRRDFTIVVCCNLLGTLTFNAIFLSVPYSHEFVDPFYSLALRRHHSTGYMELWATIAGASASARSTVEVIDNTSGMSLYVVTKQGESVKFYKQGQQAGATVSLSAYGDIDWGTRRRVCLLDRNELDPGGRPRSYLYSALVYNRALSEGEIIALHAFPFGMLGVDKQMVGTYSIPVATLPPDSERSVTDGMVMGDTAEAVVGFVGEVLDVFRISDSLISADFGDYRGVAETMELGDTPTSVIGAVGGLSEGLVVGDTPSATVTIDTSVSDGAKLGDSVVAAHIRSGGG